MKNAAIVELWMYYYDGRKKDNSPDSILRDFINLLKTLGVDQQVIKQWETTGKYYC